MKDLQLANKRATLWVTVGVAFTQISRLISNIVLTRLLPPEAFGIMALVYMFNQGVEMLSDVGIRNSVIKSDREDANYYNTAWTLQILRGFFLFVIICLLAYPVSKFYEEEALLYVMPFSGLVVLLAAFNSTSVYYLNKKMKLRQLTVYEVISAVCCFVVMLVWAWFSPTVWALAAGAVAGAGVMTFLSYCAPSPAKHRFFLEKRAVVEMLVFGGWIFLSTALAFFVLQIDRMILGKLGTLEMLGLYSIAYMWSQVPIMLTNKWASVVFYPHVAEVLRRGELASGVAALKRKVLLFTAVPILAMSFFSETMMRVIYTEEYYFTGTIAVYLLIATWFSVCVNMYTQIIVALGRPRDKLVGQVFSAIILIIFIVPIFELYGVIGVALLVGVVWFIQYVFLAYSVSRYGYIGFRQEILLSILLLIIGFLLNYIASVLLASVGMMGIFWVTLVLFFIVFMVMHQIFGGVSGVKREIIKLKGS